jgi:hypothetical protein
MIEYQRFVEQFNVPQIIGGLEISVDVVRFAGAVLYLCYACRYFGEDIVEVLIDLVELVETSLRAAVGGLTSVKWGLQKFAHLMNPTELVAGRPNREADFLDLGRRQIRSMQAVLASGGIVAILFAGVLIVSYIRGHEERAEQQRAEQQRAEQQRAEQQRIARSAATRREDQFGCTAFVLRFDPTACHGGTQDLTPPIEWTNEAIPVFRFDQLPGSWQDFSLPHWNGGVPLQTRAAPNRAR